MGGAMSTIKNSMEYYQSSQSLLSLLNSKKSGNKLINQIIANNEATYQKKMESMGISTSTSDSKYNSVSKSSTNLIDAIEGLEKESLYEAEDGKEYDISELVKKIQSFATAYNSEISAIYNCGGTVQSTFVSEFKAAYSSNQEKLMNVGITIDTEGKLVVDYDTLEKADVSTLKELLGSDSSYMKTLSTSASSINNIVNTALAYKSSNYTSSGALLS